MRSGPDETRAGLFAPMLDDKGDRCAILSTKDLKRAARDDRPALVDLARRLRCAIKAEQQRTTGFGVLWGLMTAVAAVLLTPLVMVVIFHGIPQLYSPFTPLIVFVSIIIFSHFIHRRLAKRAIRRNLAATAVAEGACGSCAFSLEGAPVRPFECRRCAVCGQRAPADQAKCVRCRANIGAGESGTSDLFVCPECGAGWHTDRVVRPHWERQIPKFLRRVWYAWIIPGVRAPATLYAPDDRGGFVQTPDARLLRIRPSRLAELGVRRRPLARRTRHAGVLWRLAAAGAFVVPCVGIALLVSATATHPLEPEETWALGFLAGIGLVTGFLIMLSALGRPPRTTARRLRDIGRCGCCLGPLDDLPIDSDGCRTCPDCGAGWHTTQVSERR